MSALLRAAKKLAIAMFGGAMAIGVLPSAGWTSCLWTDMRRMDPPKPGRDGLIVVANLCPHEMGFAFGEWNPRNGALDAWSERLPGEGDTGDFLFLAVKPNYYLMATPCQSDCKAEKDYFRARRTFSPAQSVIWPWPFPK
jgi:hypothetical protein